MELRLSQDQSPNASGSGGAYGKVGPAVLEKSDGKDKCLDQIAKKYDRYDENKVLFKWIYDTEKQEQALLEVLLYGGQLMSFLHIYGRTIEYSKEFFAKLVEVRKIT